MAGEVSSAHPEEEERRKEEDGDQPITAGQAAHLAKSTVHLGVNEHVNREVKGNPSADSSKDDEYTPDNFLHNGDRRKNNDDELVHYDYKTSSPLESLDKVPRDTLQPSPSSRRYNIEKHDSTEHMDAASWTGPLASSRSFNSCQSRNLYSSATSEEGRELLNAKLLRKKADEELMARKNRVNRLRFEEERTYKTIFVAKAKVQDVVRLKAHNQLRNQEKEHARKSKAERLREETQQNSLERARRIANIRAKQMELVRTKQDIVKNSHKEREIYAQATAQHRRAAEERASRMKKEIYIREREALHRKYKDRHLSQMRTLQLYESKLQAERRKHLERQEEIQRLEYEEARLLERLKQAQDEKKKSFSELANAIRI